MNDSKLELLVVETVELAREVERLTAELKENKKLLVAEAKARADTATKTDGGGTSVTLEGFDGSIARVTKAGGTLKSSVTEHSDEYKKIRPLCGHNFFDLFDTEVSYNLVANFREGAVHFLGKTEGAKLVKLVTNPGKTSVSFETKEAS